MTLARRGQTIGQVFTFVLAGLVFVLILGYGYRAVTTISDKSGTVALIDMENSLRDAVEAIRLDYGSEKRLTLRVPGDFKEICFVTDPNAPALSNPNRLLLQEVAKGGSQNVFTVPLAKNPISVEGITTEGGCHCSTVVQGRVDLRLSSLGNRVSISDWNLGTTC